MESWKDGRTCLYILDCCLLYITAHQNCIGFYYVDLSTVWNKIVFSNSHRKQLFFKFWFFISKGNFLNIWSCNSDIFLFLIEKHFWDRSPKQMKLFFLGGLDLIQSRLLPLMTHLTIKNSVYHKTKTLIKPYISNDSHRLNPCHAFNWMLPEGCKRWLHCLTMSFCFHSVYF